MQQIHEATLHHKQEPAGCCACRSSRSLTSGFPGADGGEMAANSQRPGQSVLRRVVGEARSHALFLRTAFPRNTMHCPLPPSLVAGEATRQLSGLSAAAGQHPKLNPAPEAAAGEQLAALDAPHPELLAAASADRAGGVAVV